MLKGNWHFLAISAFFSLMALKTNKLLLFFLLLFIWFIYLYVWNRVRLPMILLATASFIFFYSYFPPYERDVTLKQNLPQEQMTVHGTISSGVNQTDKMLSFTMQEGETDERLLVTYFIRNVEKGEIRFAFPYTHRANCTVSGKLGQPDEATNPFEFNYRQYVFEQGISNQLIVDSMEQIKCQQKSSLLSSIYSIRDRLMTEANQRLHPEIAAWQQALIFGNSDYLDESVILLFQRWGLSHLLAISGLHVGIIIAIIYFMLIRLFGVTREHASIIVLLFLPVYALLAGGQPSVWRASLMTIFIILFSTKTIKISRTDVISIVFLLLLLMNKFIIYHVGFQFSFAVTFGLILSAKWFKTAKSRIETILQISFIAQMMIVPLQMYYFYHFQPLSILLNVIIVPYFSLFVIPSMFFSFLLYFIPQSIVNLIETLFLTIHHTVISGIDLLDHYANNPFISGEITLTVAIVYYVLLIIMMSYLETSRRREAFYVGLAICLWLTSIIIKPYVSKTGMVTMLDIGQGDAFVIELPYRKGVFIVDAGATFDFDSFEPKDTVYKRVIRPYLMGRGINTIDAIFISHPHLDHHGSIRFILEEFNVHEMLISEYFEIDDKELQKWLQYTNVQFTTTKFSTRINRNGQMFYVLSPQRDTHDKNDNSLVLYAQIGKLNWLFTGDISKSVEEQIIKDFTNLEVDILKVAHHGSNTSTADKLLKETQPKVALIPVGRKNRYGHPAKEVIETLENGGIKIYRTDEDGAIQYKFRDEQFHITRFIDESNK